MISRYFSLPIIVALTLVSFLQTLAQDITPKPTPSPVARITLITPTSGPVGTKMLIKGSGFSPRGNRVNFGYGAIPNLPSPDGVTITFQVPSSLCPPCTFSPLPCLLPCRVTNPGEYKVSVTNANGSTSNTVLFTVIARPTPTPTPTPTPSPTAPKLEAISPRFGAIGTKVTLKGSGFTPTDNIVRFGYGSVVNLPSADGTTLELTVPGELCPPCVYLQGCKIACRVTVPGEYDVSVSNANGTSNSLKFKVISSVSLGEEFKLKVGDAVLVKGEALKVKFISVPEDSRCPANAICVWEGNAKVVLKLKKGEDRTKVELNTSRTYPQEVTFQNYSIKLVALDPYPMTNEKIPQERYVATLVVTKVIN
jgi:hypothetical protein